MTEDIRNPASPEGFAPAKEARLQEAMTTFESDLAARVNAGVGPIAEPIPGIDNWPGPDEDGPVAPAAPSEERLGTIDTGAARVAATPFLLSKKREWLARAKEYFGEVYPQAARPRYFLVMERNIAYGDLSNIDHFTQQAEHALRQLGDESVFLGQGDFERYLNNAYPSINSDPKRVEETYLSYYLPYLIEAADISLNDPTAERIKELLGDEKFKKVEEGIKELEDMSAEPISGANNDAKRVHDSLMAFLTERSQQRKLGQRVVELNPVGIAERMFQAKATPFGAKIFLEMVDSEQADVIRLDFLTRMRGVVASGAQVQPGWLSEWERYLNEHPDEYDELAKRVEGYIGIGAQPGITTADVQPTPEQYPPLPQPVADLVTSGDLVPLDPHADQVTSAPEPVEQIASAKKPGMPGWVQKFGRGVAGIKALRGRDSVSESLSPEAIDAREILREKLSNKTLNNLLVGELLTLLTKGYVEPHSNLYNDVLRTLSSDQAAVVVRGYDRFREAAAKTKGFQEFRARPEFQDNTDEDADFENGEDEELLKRLRAEAAAMSPEQIIAQKVAVLAGVKNALATMKEDDPQRQEHLAEKRVALDRIPSLFLQAGVTGPSDDFGKVLEEVVDPEDAAKVYDKIDELEGTDKSKGSPWAERARELRGEPAETTEASQPFSDEERESKIERVREITEKFADLRGRDKNERTAIIKEALGLFDSLDLRWGGVEAQQFVSGLNGPEYDEFTANWRQIMKVKLAKLEGK